MNLTYIIIIEFLIAFIVTFFFTRKYIELAKRKGYVGIDVHKPNKPKIPEMGGFGIVFGFLFGIAIAFPFLGWLNNLYILAAVAAIIITAFVGVFDDLFKLSPLKKIVLLLIASIPLIITKAGATTMNLPFLGIVDLGWFYTLMFIPIIFTIFANMTNFLAGYNGMDVGLGIITIFYFLVSAILLDNTIITILLIPYLGALIAFYYFNKYPAMVFPGDIGSLTIGAIIISAAIIGNAETLAVLLTVLYLINFALYFIFTFFTNLPDTKISTVDKKGILIPVFFDKNKKKKAWHKMYFLFEHWFHPLTEKGMITIFYIIQFILNALVLIFYVII
jgi:UDP-N-acetylglucosamine--dolichyl-phosphate N-acetylglucosaminephosphotransferase